MKTLAAGLVALALLLPARAEALLLPVSPRCQSAMEQAVSGYSGCRLLAKSKDTKQPDATKLSAALAKCSARFESAIFKALARYGVKDCPLTSSKRFQGYVDAFARGAVAAAAGDELPNLEPCVPTPTPEPTPGPATPTPDVTPSPCAIPYSVSNGKGGTYTDNCDGTVTDSTSGLMWEQKHGRAVSAINCTSASLTGYNGSGCYNPHNIDNTYTWTAIDASPWPFNGTAKTLFLDRLNCEGAYAGGDCTPWLGHTDWRLPTIVELSGVDPADFPLGWLGSGYSTSGIIDVTAPCCGEGLPRINPIFGPSRTNYYWSSTTHYFETPGGPRPGFAYVLHFFLGYVNYDGKTDNTYVRAVRDAQ